MTAENNRFAPESGRKRPAYQPKTIRCESCGAGLSVKNEHTEMVVCDYCGSRLDVSATEQKVLGAKQARQVSFALSLGDPFHYRGTRFEVIARMAFIEEGDPDDMTREYLLYNPRRGTLWLGEYEGEYAMTSPSHVSPKQPAGEVLSCNRGHRIETHDDTAWVADGTGEYELYYVDGALPWIASVGDRLQYAEFVEAGGSGRVYEVQRIENEIEYAAGRRLDINMVRSATRKSDLAWPESARMSLDAAATKKGYTRLLKIAFLGMVVNAVLALFFAWQGTLVVDQQFSAVQLDNGAYTKPFTVKGGDIAKIKLNAPLNNAWMELAAFVVRDDDTMVHEYQTGIEYYHGSSGGESWSEGSRNKSFMVLIPDAGTYRLFTQAVSAQGNAAKATKALHGLRVKIYDGARPWVRFVVMAVICTILLLITAIAYGKWTGAVVIQGADD